MQNEKVMELDVSQSSSSKGEMHQAGDSGNLIYCVSLVFAKASIAFLLSLGTFLNYASQFKGSDEIYEAGTLQNKCVRYYLVFFNAIWGSTRGSMFLFESFLFLLAKTVTHSFPYLRVLFDNTLKSKLILLNPLLYGFLESMISSHIKDSLVFYPTYCYKWHMINLQFIMKDGYDHMFFFQLITIREFQHDFLQSLDIDGCLISMDVNHKQFFSQDGCHLLILYDVLMLEGTDGIQDSKAALKWKLLGRILYFLGPSHSHSQMMFQKSWFLMGITVTGSSF
ncbi:uncharacterized protein [Elaeis guineensis]|uniref:Uncharacterized protein LOC105050175 isoform X1 n=1 Tax=Elaeis guineensis var. tenera TaxID=51953 RepID=A0A8N4IF41_ELAGV|nr:uncharacterized protein LOC105050175 isoform X1 [Elaeis guineensis]